MGMDFNKSRNAEKLKQIQEKSTEQANGLIVKNVPLDQIDENPDNASIFNMEGIDTLAEGIKTVGFMGAINVFQKPDGRYEISSGHRRYRAMKLLGKETIPCYVSPYPEDVDRGLMLISSNMANREIRPLDWARTIDYYMGLMKKKGEYEGRLRDRAAEFFKKSQTNIHRYTSLLKLIPELQELADNPEYAYSAFTSAATLSESDQKELYNRIMRENGLLGDKNGANVLSRTRIEQLINDLKQKNDSTAGQQNKTDGNFNVASLNSSSGDSTADTLSHSEQIEEGSSGHSENMSGIVDFDGSMNTPTDFSDDAVGESDYEPSDDEYEEAVREEKEPVKASSPSSSNGVILLDNRLAKFASDIESLSRSDFEVSDSAQAKVLLERITAAVKNIELSL